MDNQIIVSICIVVYNHENYLAQAIESVIKQQTDFQFEIIIGDDCSTDNSQEIIKNYSEKYSNIIAVLRDKNLGATRNGMDLISKAKGKFIAWLDGDDFWIDKNKLQKQVDFLENNIEYCAIGTRSKVVDENNNILPYKHYASNEIITPSNYSKTVMPNIGSIMFDSSILKNDFDSVLELFISHRIILDWTLYLYILDHSDIFIMKPPMHCYRKVLNKSTDNFSSIYRLKRNRYDVIVERMKYEQALNRFNWKRLRINYRVQTKAAELWLQYLLDNNKESRYYGKTVYKDTFKKNMTIKERIGIPFKVLGLIKFHVLEKIKQQYYKLKTKSEKNKKQDNYG